jgi:alpha-galactosidase
LPSLGLCDGLRIGPDVAKDWDNDIYSRLLYNQTTPSVKNGIRTSLNRLWLKPLLHIDPDVAYFRSIECSLTPEQKSLLQDLTEICQFKATSDLPQWWTTSEREQVRAWLETNPASLRRTGPGSFQLDQREVDFSPALELPTAPRGIDRLLRALYAWGGGQNWIMRNRFKAWKNKLGKTIVHSLKLK